jgi:hypothetical protein
MTAPERRQVLTISPSGENRDVPAAASLKTQAYADLCGEVVAGAVLTGRRHASVADERITDVESSHHPCGGIELEDPSEVERKLGRVTQSRYPLVGGGSHPHFSGVFSRDEMRPVRRGSGNSDCLDSSPIWQMAPSIWRRRAPRVFPASSMRNHADETNGRSSGMVHLRVLRSTAISRALAHFSARPNIPLKLAKRG